MCFVQTVEYVVLITLATSSGRVQCKHFVPLTQSAIGSSKYYRIHPTLSSFAIEFLKVGSECSLFSRPP